MSLSDYFEEYDHLFTNVYEEEGNYKEQDLKKYVHRINLEKYVAPGLDGNSANTMLNMMRRNDRNRYRRKDKKDRATVEQVLDKRTMNFLLALIRKDIFYQIYGCISTGKEANVYYATNLKLNLEYAVKIFKTSILEFKDRDKYVNGEFRFRNGYCRHNPRKMVQMWAEKEFRNLLRICKSDIRAPRPVILKNHVIVEEFIGVNGWPAPKLKDAYLDIDEFTNLYKKCIVIMWKLYNVCKLVHADLSEYNILYHNNELVIIDVSQSVEHDHHRASVFLRKDCTNITNFFQKKGVFTLSIEVMYKFITDLELYKTNLDDSIDKICKNFETNFNVNENDNDDEYFKNMYIPNRLDDVIDPERDIFDTEPGTSNKDLVYKTMIDVSNNESSDNESDNDDISNNNCDNDDISNNNSDNDDISNNNSDNDRGNNDPKKTKNVLRPKNESPEERRLRKKAFKQLQAEKRKVKVKKYTKKKLNARK